MGTLERRVQLGFAEETRDDEAVLFDLPTWGEWDGGVAGGDGPILLARDEAPREEWARCECCSKKMSFLAQIYAPLDEPLDAFHRCLYILVCRYCGQGSKAFRSQLPRTNTYYSYESEKCIDLESSVPVVGLGPALSEGRYELVVESEPEATEMYCEKKEAPELSPMNEEDAKMTQHEMNRVAGAGPAPDPLTLRFLARCSREPAQVLRYQRGGTPLWVSTAMLSDQETLIEEYDEDDDDEDIEASGQAATKHPGIQPPPCPYCSAPRIFEFQLLPQLLHALRIDAQGNDSRNLNFGAIYIFTCAKSCRPRSHESPYLREYSFLQPPLDDHPSLVPPTSAPPVSTTSASVH